jgi:hypothetical protein
VSPLWAAVGRTSRSAQSARPLDLQALVQAPAYATRIDGTRADTVEIVRDWNGPRCSARVVNAGRAPVRLKDIVLFDLDHALPPATQLYG